MFVSSLNSFGELLARGCFDPLAPYNSWTWKVFAFWLELSSPTTSNIQSTASTLDSQGFGEATVVIAGWFGFFPQANSRIKDNYWPLSAGIQGASWKEAVLPWTVGLHKSEHDVRPKAKAQQWGVIFRGLRVGLEWAFQILLLGTSLPQRKVIPSLTHGDYF